MHHAGLVSFDEELSLRIPKTGSGALDGRSVGNAFSSRIILDRSLRQIQIEGTSAGDRVVATELDQQTVRVFFFGVETKEFNIADVDSLRFRGRNGDDRFENRTGLESYAYGHNGNDTLIGGSSKDLFFGGDGADVLYGKLGPDEIRGLHGDDTILGGGGNDYLYGAFGNDFIDGGSGRDVIFGNSGHDHLLGGGQNDQIRGGDGNDRIEGGNGNDRIFGHRNYDTLLGDDGDDWIYGGDHSDNIDGGIGNDRLFGDDGNDTVRTAAGSNFINGGAGHDQLYGGRHQDEIWGGIGRDTIDGGRGDDLIRGDSGNDHLDGDAGNDRIYGGLNEDLLIGGSGNDQLYGEHGNDEILGKSGYDKLVGGSGDDILIGGQGSQRDSLDGGTGADHLIYFASDVLIQSNASDLRIKLQDKTSSWTDAEISVVNRTLDLLHQATGNSRLVQDAITGNDLWFQKFDQLPNGSIAVNRLTYTTVNGITTYQRVIQFADWDETHASRQTRQAYVMVHEIAHNWDNDFELNAAAGVSYQDALRFRAISNWRASNPGSGYLQSDDGQWWYRNDAQFARSYGRSNPYEDWATAWESFFNPAYSRPASQSNLGQKFSEIQRFLDKLK